MSGPRVSAVLLDMDGVIRHWHGTDRAAEEAGGLAPGTLGRVIFDVPEYAASQIGGATYAEWVAAIEQVLSAEFGAECARKVAAEWALGRGDVDAEMIDLIKRLRAQVPVGLLSNATDRLLEDLRHHGLHEAFDVVLSSAQLRIAKPDPAIFRHAAAAMGQPPGDCFFADDLVENVEGARSTGMRAAVFTSRPQLEAELAALGLDV
ncbi:MAG: putative hydrolase of the superfamily [Frankiaceae bacterium]|nr:putative hydrolase of the superfamily [Frankiaceae bacterium]